MARQRMYVFERAYVDYSFRARRFASGTLRRCGAVWLWFWSGFGAVAIEWLLRILIIISALSLAAIYVRYESAHGRGFSAGMAGVFLVIVLFTAILAWGWKAPIHWLARLFSAASASGPVLLLAIGGLIVVTAVFSVYLAVLLVWTALSFLVFLPLRAGQEVWLLYRRVSYQCPHGDCGATGLPIHICDCGAEYSDLLPSFYGLFSHTCRHTSQAKKLPTLDCLGRNKLARLCRGCKRPIQHSSFGELAEQPIALAGGTSTGKTVLLAQALRGLTEHYAACHGVTAIDSAEQVSAFETMVQRLASGRVPEKTAGGFAKAWTLAVRVSRGTAYPKGLRSLLLLFDNPGELFVSGGQLSHMRALQNMKGIILLVDPFSLPVLSQEADLHPEIKVSQDSFLNVAGALVQGARQYLTLDQYGKCGVPLAVVITKVDALKRFEHAHSFLAVIQPVDGKLNDERWSASCRQAIERLGGAPSLRALELNFSSIRFFACSALGRMPGTGGGDFQPAGVLEPFFWVLGSRGRM